MLLFKLLVLPICYAAVSNFSVTEFYPDLACSSPPNMATITTFFDTVSAAPCSYRSCSLTTAPNIFPGYSTSCRVRGYDNYVTENITDAMNVIFGKTDYALLCKILFLFNFRLFPVCG